MKVPLTPPVGHVIAYEYLWHSKLGTRNDGEKTYPAAVVLARDDMGPTPVAYVLGISHSPPRVGQRALEVPAKLKRHLGLDDAPSWIYTDELNVFSWPGPDIRPAEHLSNLPKARNTCVIGPLPTDRFSLVKAHLVESYGLGPAKTMRR
ncbi:plasmid maintenance toxin (PemK-like) [Allorhizobium pseudoryzae]|uniref:plasmid maintenance toxin (PemK-like) n=1 Tax=Allorhizobium pseudoryzae TaxID=379684 RepID=UPI003D020DA6